MFTILSSSKKKLQRQYSENHDPLIKNQINKLGRQIKKYTKSASNEN